MSASVLPQAMTIEDFLAWEAREEMKHEFDGLGPVAMAGGSLAHVTIQTNLAISVGGRLRGSGCAFFGSDLKVVTGDRVRYPDGQVICGPRNGAAKFTTSPVVLFEIVSPQYEQVDRVVKLAEYKRIPSVRQYLILAQDRMAATVARRDGDTWTSEECQDGVLSFPELGIEVPLAELYEGVEFA